MTHKQLRAQYTQEFKMEAVRQVRHEVGRDNVFFVHVSLVPYLAQSFGNAADLTKGRQALGLREDGQQVVEPVVQRPLNAAVAVNGLLPVRGRVQHGLRLLADLRATIP